MSPRSNRKIALGQRSTLQKKTMWPRCVNDLYKWWLSDSKQVIQFCSLEKNWSASDVKAPVLCIQLTTNVFSSLTEKKKKKRKRKRTTFHLSIRPPRQHMGILSFVNLTWRVIYDRVFYMVYYLRVLVSIKIIQKKKTSFGVLDVFIRR